MDRPTLKVRLEHANPLIGSVELDGKPIYVRSIEIIAQADRLVEASVNGCAHFHPEHLEVDLDARCLRLNGAQLPEEVGRALLAQLKELYGEA